MELRPYQSEAVNAIERALERNRSTLLVMATGTGKTVVFTDVIRRFGGRALVVAHRGELLDQATATLEAAGLSVDREQAAEYARKRSMFALSDAVCAMAQTLGRQYRLKDWPRDAFKLIVIDECHHAPAKLYKNIVEHFGCAKILGVTATPDRGDGVALRRLFDTVAYRYEIDAGIRDGYLAPIVAKVVQVSDLSLDGVKCVAGDLTADGLSAEMTRSTVLEGIAKPLLELAGQRKTIAFGPTVEFAHSLARVLNQYEAGCAVAVDGSMDMDERKHRLNDSDARIIVNCSLYTEGYDNPELSCVAMCRPTKSRALYTQCAGRGTRPCPRCAVPSATPCEHKPNMLLLDFTGASRRHSLIGPVDLLGGVDADPKVSAKARRILAKANSPMSVQEAVDLAAKRSREEEIKRRHAAIKYTAQAVNPLRLTNPEGREPERPQWRNGVSQRQAMLLQRFGVTVEEIQRMNGGAAGKLLQRLFDRAKAGLCSYKQAKVLRRNGYSKEELNVMGFEEAKVHLDALFGRWKKDRAA